MLSSCFFYLFFCAPFSSSSSFSHFLSFILLSSHPSIPGGGLGSWAVQVITSRAQDVVWSWCSSVRLVDHISVKGWSDSYRKGDCIIEGYEELGVDKEKVTDAEREKWGLGAPCPPSPPPCHPLIPKRAPADPHSPYPSHNALLPHPWPVDRHYPYCINVGSCMQREVWD